MGCVVVYIERDRDRPSPSSLGALAAARSLANAAGATVYALCSLGEADDLDVWASALGAAGCDRVAAARSDRPQQPVLWSTHGEILAEICLRLEPRLVLAPSTPGARDVAPRLAARLGAAYVPEADLEHSAAGDVIVSRPLPCGTQRLRYQLADPDTSCVATVTTRAPGDALGDDDVDVVFFEVEAPAPTHELIDTEPDLGNALAEARVVVTAGAGVAGAAELELVARLADALGGELAGTRRLCARGLISVDRVIGLSGRNVAPELYVAVASSGSAEHLGAVAPDTDIVAINRDRDAPIFELATYGLVGELEELLPALIAELSTEPSQ